MTFVKICCILIATMFVALILRERDSSFSRIIGITGVVIAFIYAVKAINPFVEYTLGIGFVSEEIVNILIKSLGISYLTEFGASICRDANESSLGYVIELCGKIQILLVGFPLFKSVFEVCTSLI